MNKNSIYWALRQDTGRHSAKLVLISLAFLSGKNNFSSPSLTELCDRTGLSKKTVISCLDYLEEIGLILDNGTRTNGSKDYELLIKTSDGFEEFLRAATGGIQ